MGNVHRTAWRIVTLMLACEGLICSVHSDSRTLLPRTPLMFARPLFDLPSLTDIISNEAPAITPTRVQMFLLGDLNARGTVLTQRRPIVKRLTVIQEIL